MENISHIHFAVISILGTGSIVAVLTGIIKAADWLISLKYLTKDDYNIYIAQVCSELSAKFATVESHNYLKEDIDEIKNKLNDIHGVIMTFAVNNFKEQ